MGKIKEPANLSPRIKWLRDFYFQGADREWNNEFRPFTTGTSWDRNYNEISYYVVPETYTFFKPFNQSFRQGAVTIKPPPDFFKKSIAERQAWFVKKAMTDYVPQEILPGDLLCGAVFNLAASHCLTEEESRRKDAIVDGKKGLTKRTIEFHDRGFGNCGPTSGHIIPGYELVIKHGFKYIYGDIKAKYDALGE
jgi:formate C-acetyltransferase